MFSKQESSELKSLFWTTFGKSFPKKWILHRTKIKDFSFKFHSDNRSASVFLDIEMKDESLREIYFNKIWSLEDVLSEALGEKINKDFNFTLENSKIIARFWITKNEVSILDKNSWQKIFIFFVEKMTIFEQIFLEYEDFIKDIENSN